MSKKFFFIFIIFFTIISEAKADVGVGVGLGQIKVHEVLLPGGVYNLPKIPVVNTGDEATNYQMEVAYVSGHELKNPEKSWFAFSPKNFSLEPKRSLMVRPQLQLSLAAPAGDYFAFLEARAAAKPRTTPGGVLLGPAAATKLYFTVCPSPGVLGALRQRIYSYYRNRLDLVYLLAAALCLLLACVILKRHFEIRPKRSTHSNTHPPQPHNHNITSNRNGRRSSNDSVSQKGSPTASPVTENLSVRPTNLSAR